MSTTFNISQLAKGMSAQDKARILIGDVEEKTRTDGTGLLTAAEKDAIVEDAGKRNELREINRIYNLYQTEFALSMDVFSRLQTLMMQIAVLEKIILAAYLAGAGIDAIDKIFHDLAPDEDKEKLYKKYDFDIKLISKNILISEGKLLPQLPEALIGVVDLVKVLRGYMYEMEYVQSKTSVQVIMPKEQETLDDCEKIIGIVVKLEDTLRPISIFRDYDLIEDIDDDSQRFIHAVRDMEKATELDEDEKARRRTKVDKYVER